LTLLEFLLVVLELLGLCYKGFSRFSFSSFSSCKEKGEEKEKGKKSKAYGTIQVGVKLIRRRLLPFTKKREMAMPSFMMFPK
jgi:hypothetical protein